MGCTCEKQEVGKGLGKVKGYVTTVECNECKAKREAENIARAEKEAKRKKEVDKDALINAKLKEMGTAELIKEGKLNA